MDTAAACEPCTDVPSERAVGRAVDDSSRRRSGWADARLLTFLESASLLRLADSLRAARSMSLSRCLARTRAADSTAGSPQDRGRLGSQRQAKVRVGARQGHP